jgi:hypothetical protein
MVGQQGLWAIGVTYHTTLISVWDLTTMKSVALDSIASDHPQVALPMSIS